jgi:hypothetical protein
MIMSAQEVALRALACVVTPCIRSRYYTVPALRIPWCLSPGCGPSSPNITIPKTQQMLESTVQLSFMHRYLNGDGSLYLCMQPLVLAAGESSYRTCDLHPLDVRCKKHLQGL